MQSRHFWAKTGTFLAEMVTLEGVQEPVVTSVPEWETSLGDEAIDLCRQAGLALDPWQELPLRAGLGLRKDGKWAAFEIGLVVSRQNGKGAILEARELAGLFLVKERLQIHSAHQFDTSLEAFRRLLTLIEDTPDLDKQVKRVSRSHGEEGIELKDGCRIRFRTRTKGGGRGFSCDALYLDEAMELPEFAHGALLPTLSARPNSQVWYTGSAVDQLVHDHGVVLARIRERGHRGKDKSLAYFEWFVDTGGDVHLPDGLPEEVVSDPERWAQANPGLGIRILPEHVENERRSMDPRTFAVERLGIGDWPVTDKSLQSVINMEVWKNLTDERSQTEGSVCFAYDVSPNRSSSCIAVAGKRSDGLAHVEIVDHRAGTGWVVDRLVELRDRWQPSAVLCDSAGPAGALIDALEDRQVKVEAVSAKEHARACGAFFDLVEQEALRHLGSPALKVALQGAKTRPLGDAWAWARKKSAVDITPLVASTLALWGAMRDRPSVYRQRGVGVVGADTKAASAGHYVDGEWIAA